MTDTSHQRRYLRIACILGSLAVITGAFGAHGLEEQLDAHHLDIWKTAVDYHFYHALALLAFAGGAPPGIGSRSGGWACRLWLVGIVVFSGTLYLFAVTGVSWFGAITPIGGLALIAGWILAAIAAGSAAAK